MIVCNGPCRPTDCCEIPVTKPIPPVYQPPQPSKHCVPLRSRNNKCVIQTGYNAHLGEARLSVGSCSDSRVVSFCGCTLKTADNMCVTSTQNTGRNGAALVLRKCGKCTGKAKTWQYLSDGEDSYYMRNGFAKYMHFDQYGKTLIQTTTPGYFFLEQPCRARIENKPVPQPPAPFPSQTCAAFQCPYGWQKVLDASFGMQLQHQRVAYGTSTLLQFC
jgi:hypothetical protein